MILLALAFLLTALLYASVGFGGGSTYNALLVFSGIDYRILPAIALLCNIIVVCGGVWRFGRQGHLDVKKTIPFIITSVPCAFIGGLIPISEVYFLGILGFLLTIAGIQMLLPKSDKNLTSIRQHAVYFAWGIGAVLGFLSGLVGIGGGIFLAPIMYLMRWDTARGIAASCSFFILVNSLSGLAGQLIKLGDMQQYSAFMEYWMLFPAVFVGGQVGSRMGSTTILSEAFLRRTTAVLVLYAGARLMLRWFNLVAG